MFKPRDFKLWGVFGAMASLLACWVAPDRAAASEPDSESCSHQLERAEPDSHPGRHEELIRVLLSFTAQTDGLRNAALIDPKAFEASIGVRSFQGLLESPDADLGTLSVSARDFVAQVQALLNLNPDAAGGFWSEFETAFREREARERGERDRQASVGPVESGLSMEWLPFKVDVQFGEFADEAGLSRTGRYLYVEVVVTDKAKPERNSGRYLVRRRQIVDTRTGEARTLRAGHLHVARRLADLYDPGVSEHAFSEDESELCLRVGNTLVFADTATGLVSRQISIPDRYYLSPYPDRYRMHYAGGDLYLIAREHPKQQGVATRKHLLKAPRGRSSLQTVREFEAIDSVEIWEADQPLISLTRVVDAQTQTRLFRLKEFGETHDPFASASNLFDSMSGALWQLTRGSILGSPFLVASSVSEREPQIYKLVWSPLNTDSQLIPLAIEVENRDRNIGSTFAFELDFEGSKSLRFVLESYYQRQFQRVSQWSLVSKFMGRWSVTEAEAFTDLGELKPLRQWKDKVWAFDKHKDQVLEIQVKGARVVR